jgi:hypothetical protein
MECETGRQSWGRRLAPVRGGMNLVRRGIAWGVLPARTMGGLQAALLLLLLLGCATLGSWDDSQRDHGGQNSIAAHPEWPPEVLAAVTAGLISQGMSPDMVRAAWGQPTHRRSDGRGPPWHETWYYKRPQHAVDMIGGRPAGALPSVYWTVSFAQDGVVAWTD